jgi:hypothetical protein
LPVPRRTVIALVLFVLPVLAGRAIAQSPAPVGNGTVTSGRLSFDGHATVGDFTGVTDSVRGAFVGAATLDSVRGWVEAPVATLTTGNGHRDRDLNSSMESGRFPVIRYELAGMTPSAPRGDTVDAVLHGAFRIHGVARAADVPATLVFSPGAAHLHADVPLDLGDYDVKGLSKFLGVLKMHPGITVHVDLAFRLDERHPEGAAPPARTRGI